MDDRVIDFNELKNRVNDKDIDKFENYMYDLYYQMASGKLTMADFSKEIMTYMEKNNISQDKFLKMQTKLMERYGLDTSAFEDQLKALGLDKFSAMGNMEAEYEKARKEVSFKDKYNKKVSTKAVMTYSVNNDKNKLDIVLENENVILKSEGKIDLTDLELNEFLVSYKKLLNDTSLNISICESVQQYQY